MKKLIFISLFCLFVSTCFAMTIKFNPSGTQIRNGFLVIRVDIFPSPSDKTYALHYISKPIIPPSGYSGEMDMSGNPVNPKDYQLWLDSLPHSMELNPCLSSFLRISEIATKEDITALINQTFSPSILKTLDDILILPNSADLVSVLMRSKVNLSASVVQTEVSSLIESVNLKLKDLAITKDSGDKGIEILPETIVVGPGATDRTGSGGSNGVTFCDKNIPANATGQLNSFEIWCASSMTGTYACTFSGVSTSITSNDNCSIGNITAGSKQTIDISALGLSIVTGEFIGIYNTSGGTMEFTDSGGARVFRYVGDGRSATNTYTDYAGYMSVYATGTESGGTVIPSAYIQSLMITKDAKVYIQ